MKRPFKKWFSLILAIVCFTAAFAAPIFEGVTTQEGGEIGLCLGQNPPEECANVFCQSPAFATDPRCLSEAQAGTELTENALRSTGITHTEDAGDLILKTINFALPYLALAAFLGFVVSGFLYVTAFGNDERMEKAKKIMIYAVVGLLLVIASYTIVQFLTSGFLGRLNA